MPESHFLAIRTQVTNNRDTRVTPCLRVGNDTMRYHYFLVFARLDSIPHRSTAAVVRAQLLAAGFSRAPRAAPRPASGSVPDARAATPQSSAAPVNLWTRTEGSDWPGFLGPQRNGKSTEEGIRTDWSAGLPIVWQRSLGTGYGIGSVSRGRFFQFDRYGDRRG